MVAWGKSISFYLPDGSTALLMADTAEVDMPTLATIRPITDADNVRLKVSYIAKGTKSIVLSNNGYNVKITFGSNQEGSWKIVY